MMSGGYKFINLLLTFLKIKAFLDFGCRKHATELINKALLFLSSNMSLCFNGLV